MEIKEPTVVVFIYLHKLVHMNARRAACHQSLSCNGTRNWEDFLSGAIFVHEPSCPASGSGLHFLVTASGRVIPVETEYATHSMCRIKITMACKER